MTAAAAATAAAVLVVAAGIATAWWLRRRFVMVTVVGASMRPTLADGDRVVVRRHPATACRRGDLLVFTPPHLTAEDSPEGLQLLVKRVVAIPGDPVPEEVAAAVGAAPGTPVPPDRLVVRGDDPVSQDSRHFGYVPGQDVLGTVVRVTPGATVARPPGRAIQ